MTHTTNDAPVTVEPDWHNADVCIENMQIAYDNATEDEDETPVDTVVSAGDLGVLIGLAQYAVRHRLAALASAPAGDGVEDAEAIGWLVEWTAAGQDWVEAFACEVNAVDKARAKNGKCTPLYPALARPRAAVGEPFPQPQRRDGKPPCGECRLPVGETCDICGARQ